MIRRIRAFLHAKYIKLCRKSQFTVNRLGNSTCKKDKVIYIGFSEMSFISINLVVNLYLTKSKDLIQNHATKRSHVRLNMNRNGEVIVQLKVIQLNYVYET